MKIIVLYPQICRKSATALANAIGAKADNPYQSQKKDYRDFDLVINYGCNRNIKAQRLINGAKAVACCIDKLRTFTVLKEAGGINIPEFTTNAAKVKDWPCVVVRHDVDGAGNKGMRFIDPQDQPIPDAPLYTKYFAHHKEYRVVVVPVKNGIMSCNVYEKVQRHDEWTLTLVDSIHFDDMKAHCLKAADALRIDYVGFDVVMNKQKQFVILEANSGPIITDEAITAFKKLLKNVV